MKPLLEEAFQYIPSFKNLTPDKKEIALRILASGIVSATKQQNELGSLLFDYQKKEHTVNLRSLLNALKKIESNKGSLAIAQKSIKSAISQFHYDDLEAYDTFTDELLSEACKRDEGSIFKEWSLGLSDMPPTLRSETAKKLIRCVEVSISGINPNVPKGHKRTLKKYIAGIKALMVNHLEAFPQLTITYHNQTSFHAYATYWINSYLTDGTQIKYFERHIKEAIEYKSNLFPERLVSKE